MPGCISLHPFRNAPVTHIGALLCMLPKKRRKPQPGGAGLSRNCSLGRVNPSWISVMAPMGALFQAVAAGDAGILVGDHAHAAVDFQNFLRARVDANAATDAIIRADKRLDMVFHPSRISYRPLRGALSCSARYHLRRHCKEGSMKLPFVDGERSPSAGGQRVAHTIAHPRGAVVGQISKYGEVVAPPTCRECACSRNPCARSRAWGGWGRSPSRRR